MDIIIEVSKFCDTPSAFNYIDGVKCFDFIKGENYQLGEKLIFDFTGIGNALTRFWNPIVKGLIDEYTEKSLESMYLINHNVQIMRKLDIVIDGLTKDS